MNKIDFGPEYKKFLKREKEIYEELDGKPLNIVSLTEALSEIMPNIDKDEIKEACYDLLTGISKGEMIYQETFGDIDLSNDPLKQIILKIPENRRKETMIQLISNVNQLAGKELSFKDISDLEGKSEDELIKDLEDLNQNKVITEETIKELKNIESEIQIPLKDKYNEKERLWISAAATYSNMDLTGKTTEEKKQITETIGQNVKVIKKITCVCPNIGNILGIGGGTILLGSILLGCFLPVTLPIFFAFLGGVLISWIGIFLENNYNGLEKTEVTYESVPDYKNNPDYTK